MRVQPSFNEFQEKIIIALAYRQDLNKAAIIKQGVYELIRKMPEHEIQALIKQYDELTPEQKLNPKK